MLVCFLVLDCLLWLVFCAAVICLLRLVLRGGGVEGWDCCDLSHWDGEGMEVERTRGESEGEGKRGRRRVRGKEE